MLGFPHIYRRRIPSAILETKSSQLGYYNTELFSLWEIISEILLYELISSTEYSPFETHLIMYKVNKHKLLDTYPYLCIPRTIIAMSVLKFLIFVNWNINIEGI